MAQQKDKTVAYRATGRRKDAVAQVRLVPGDGKFDINGKSLEDYFGRETHRVDIQRPMELTETRDKYDIVAKITGGGMSGQAGALRHGLARALLEANEEFRDDLKKAGLLTRDQRMTERKKYGLKKARKRPQFSKR